MQIVMKKIKEELKNTTILEVLGHSASNFVYGLLGATIVVSITLGFDMAVLLAYLSYYFYLGKVINRPKYVTSIGKFIVFPVPTAIGAFTGYKLAPVVISLLV